MAKTTVQSDETINEATATNTDKLRDTLKEMEALKAQMAALATEMSESGEVKQAIETLDVLKAESDEFDKQITELMSRKTAVLEEMVPYHELLAMTGNTHPTMSKKRASGTSSATGVKRTPLKDPTTGKVYSSYADACKENGIDVKGASGHVKWVSTMGYDLVQTEE